MIIKNFLFVLFFTSSVFSEYSQAGEFEKILINQVAKTFTKEKDEKVIKKLKKMPWKAQKKKVDYIEAKIGDILIFHNSDNFVHNVYSSFFDLKTQAPGKSSEVKLEKEGEFEVQCAIHPKMKLKLKVKKK